jgi:hypothetical protein
MNDFCRPGVMVPSRGLAASVMVRRDGYRYQAFPSGRHRKYPVGPRNSARAFRACLSVCCHGPHQPGRFAPVLSRVTAKRPGFCCEVNTKAPPFASAMTTSVPTGARPPSSKVFSLVMMAIVAAPRALSTRAENYEWR